jgi:hypothetical protein
MHSIHQAPASHNVYSKRGDGRDDIGVKQTTKIQRFSVESGQKEISHSQACVRREDERYHFGSESVMRPGSLTRWTSQSNSILSRNSISTYRSPIQTIPRGSCPRDADDGQGGPPKMTSSLGLQSIHLSNLGLFYGISSRDSTYSGPLGRGKITCTPALSASRVYTPPLHRPYRYS